jgi:polyferredoxin
MRARTARRVSQVFFLAVMVWFVLAATLGPGMLRLAGWPVNWLLELDPLAALGTLAATGELYAGMAWALATLGLTLLLGRFFCGWVCPFGTLHQAAGWLAWRGRRLAARAEANRPRPAQAVKYYLLLVLLAAAAGDLMGRLDQGGGWWLAGAGAACLAGLAAWEAARRRPAAGLWAAGILAGWLALAWLAGRGGGAGGYLAGLLDPIPLMQRSLSLALLPLADGQGAVLGGPRHYDGAWLIAAVFLAALGLNLASPRFYCRFVCPLGALLGLCSRFSPGRVARTAGACSQCRACEASCEGACAPAGELRWSECVLCLNCLEACEEGVMTYRGRPSAAGERPGPDLTRRGVALSVASGALALPFLRLGGGLARAWPAELVRPPGALDEERFLARCLRCGQCMRVCPTGVIQPAGPGHGLERLWTPVLDMRIGAGACLVHCVACSQICPTAALTPLTPARRREEPIRLGTAFVDRGRCLPWAMDRPCIVCQENCPVSPKAIYTRTELRPVYGGGLAVGRAEGDAVELARARLAPGALAGGDYFAAAAGGRRRILANGPGRLELAPGSWPRPLEPSEPLTVLVRLQRPFVDPARCVGCGACQHECPVAGLAAIRVSAENASRNPAHRLLPGGEPAIATGGGKEDSP